VSKAKRILDLALKSVDAEMFQKGWWMLLLIIGTIGVLFTICSVMISQY
jgi:hypothetical protein